MRRRLDAAPRASARARPRGCSSSSACRRRAAPPVPSPARAAATGTPSQGASPASRSAARSPRQSLTSPVSRKTGTGELEAVYEARVVSRPPTDDELVERARGGDAVAFDDCSSAPTRRSPSAPRTSSLATPPTPRTRRRWPSRTRGGRSRAFAAAPPCGRGCSRSSPTRPATGDARRGVAKGWRCARRTSFPRGARLRLPREGWSPPRPAPSCSPGSSSCATTTASCSPAATCSS